MPLGKQISLPWSTTLPTGEITAAVPQSPHSAKSPNSDSLTGLWVTFDIDGDQYWLQTKDDVLDPPYGTAWLWWAVAAGLASLFGATLLARHVVQPLAKLSDFANQVSKGIKPEPLPEDASTSEIQAVNVSFNRMVEDLAHMEADRELLLAGVSHDLRTPITRLRLEIELASHLPEHRGEIGRKDFRRVRSRSGEHFRDDPSLPPVCVGSGW